jgi:hypothetical protein
MRALFCVISLLAAACLANSQDIRLIETTSEGPNILRHISTRPLDMDVNNPRGVDIWIPHAPGQQNEPFVANRDGTVAVLNIRPATKWRQVYLLLSFQNRQLTVDADFNARLAALCRSHRKKIAEREIWVKSIEGNVLRVGSRAYAIANYALEVEVERNGDLKLLKYSERRIDEETVISK